MEKINKEILSKLKYKYNTNYIFNCSIDILWEILKDQTNLYNNNIISLFFGNFPFYINNTNIYFDENTQVVFHLSDKILNILNVNYLIETDYFYEISWIIKFIDKEKKNNNDFMICNMILTSDIENQTNFFADYLFSSENLLKVLKEEEIKRHYYYKYLEKYIEKQEYLKKFTNKILIKGNYEKGSQLFDHIKLVTEFYSEVVSASLGKLFKKDNELILKIKNKKLYNGKEVFVKYVLGKKIINSKIKKNIYEINMSMLHSIATKGLITIEINQTVFIESYFFLSVTFEFNENLEKTNLHFWKACTVKFLKKMKQIMDKYS